MLARAKTHRFLALVIVAACNEHDEWVLSVGHALGTIDTVQCTYESTMGTRGRIVALRTWSVFALLLACGTSPTMPRPDATTGTGMEGGMGNDAGADAKGSFAPFLFTAEMASNTVAKVDLATGTVMKRVEVGQAPVDLAHDSARGYVYVSASEDGLSVVRMSDLNVASLAVPGLGKAPIGLAFTSAGDRLLVTTRGSDGKPSADDTVDFVSLNATTWPPTAKLEGSTSVREHPVCVLIDQKGTPALVNVRDKLGIALIDMSTRAIVAQAANLPAHAEPEGCSRHPSKNIAYVTLHGTSRSIQIVDLDARNFGALVPIAHTESARPSGGWFTPDGNRFYVSGQSVNTVFLFDTSTVTSPTQDTPVALKVGIAPHTIIFVGDKAYVANTANGRPTGSISVIANWAATPTVEATIASDLKDPLGFVFVD